MTEAALPLVLGGVASAAGNYLGAQATANANKQAAQLQQQRYQQNAAYQEPYIHAGQNALAAYNNGLGLGTNGQQGTLSAVDAAKAAPGFQSSVDYGLGQIQASNAARGLNLSGNTLAALQDYSQKNLYDAYQRNLSDLFREAQLGESGAAALSGVGTTSANNQGNFTAAAGNSLGNSYNQIGNTTNSTLNGLNNYYNKPAG